MPTIFGDYLDLDNDHEHLTISFSPSSLPLHSRWRSNGLSADFLADYCRTFFSLKERDSTRRQADIKNAIAYIANELLENSMKFTHQPSQHSISIRLVLLPDECYFYVTNCVDPDSIESFQMYLRTFLDEDPGELFLRQLEINAHSEDGSVSRLGFLTMVCNYQARLAWKFTDSQDRPNVIMVTTMVRLTV